MGGDGPRATPAWADGRVFALGGTGELRSLDEATGRVFWRTNILEDAGAPNLQWGMAASPLIVDDTVVVLPGGSGGRSVVAYSRVDGKRVWSALDDQQSYSSPMLAEINGVRQILVFSAARVVGLTPVTGEVLWEYPWKTDYDVNASQPVIVSGTHVFLSSGYGHGAVMLEVTRADPKWSVREVWRNIRMKNQFSTSLLHDGYLYGLDESILACLDAATGDVKWKGGRYGYGQVVLARDASGSPGVGQSPRHRRQDLEPPRHQRWLPPRPQRHRDGGLRPSLTQGVRSRIFRSPLTAELAV
jgi:outer membrane protein assembly factor BamB